MSAFDNDYGDDEAWARSRSKREAKSLMVWKDWDDLYSVHKNVIGALLDFPSGDRYEYAHDLSGRFLGVFREVKP